jgi:hypothetical protein
VAGRSRASCSGLESIGNQAFLMGVRLFSLWEGEGEGIEARVLLR